MSDDGSRYVHILHTYLVDDRLGQFAISQKFSAGLILLAGDGLIGKIILTRPESHFDGIRVVRGKYQAGAVFDPSFMQSIGSLLISPVFSPTSLTPIYHLERFHITFIFHLDEEEIFEKKVSTYSSY